MSRLQRLHKQEQGQAFVLFVLLIAVFGGMAALAVDLGSYSADRRDLQNAADAIALAASQELPDESEAQDVADEWAAKNDIDLSGMTVTITQQSLPNDPNPKVQVSLTRDHNFTFARLVGITSSSLTTSATAIRTSPGGSPGLVPWSVTQPVLSAVPPGQTTTMKYDSNNVTSGNFGAIRIDGSGANIYRDTIEFGSNTGLCATGVVGCPYADNVNVETGNLVGPTRVATNYRMDNADTACDTWAEAVVVTGTKHFIRPECNPYGSGGNADSLRIITIPVVASLCNGSCTVSITQFALFFLEGYGAGGCNGNKCDIKGRFIDSNTNYGAQVGVFNASALAHFVRLVD